MRALVRGNWPHTVEASAERRFQGVCHPDQLTFTGKIAYNC
jgi:hypothetical protein